LFLVQSIKETQFPGKNGKMKIFSIFKKSSRTQNYEGEKLIKSVEKIDQSKEIPPDTSDKVKGKKGLFKGSWTWREILILCGVAVIVIVVAGVIMYFALNPGVFGPFIPTDASHVSICF